MNGASVHLPHNIPAFSSLVCDEESINEISICQEINL